MIKKLAVQEGIGMQMGYSDGPNFTIFDVGFHYHPQPREMSVLTIEDACSFRVGIYFTILNFGFKIGKFWRNINETDHESIPEPIQAD